MASSFVPHGVPASVLCDCAGGLLSYTRALALRAAGLMWLNTVRLMPFSVNTQACPLAMLSVL